MAHGHYDDAVMNAAVYMSKSFGFVGGAAGAQPYLAWRTGPQSLPTNIVKLSISTTSRSAGGWSTARVVVTGPDGATLETPCVDGHCIVEVNEAAPGYLYEIEYLDASGAVVAKSGTRNLETSALRSLE